MHISRLQQLVFTNIYIYTFQKIKNIIYTLSSHHTEKGSQNDLIKGMLSTDEFH